MRIGSPTALRFTPLGSSWLLKRRDIVTIALWPLAAALAIFGLWALTQAKIAQEQAVAKQAIDRHVHAIASSYANQLEQVVHQLDQIVLNLKYDWEDPNAVVDIEKKRQRGLFPNNAAMFASVINAEGKMVTSSLITGTYPDFNGADFFQAHKRACCANLLINEPQLAVRLKRNVIRMSRRLELPDGRFDGVAFVSVEPSYLLPFQREGLSQDDFISVRLTTGPLLASRIGSDAPSFRMLYRSEPVFLEPAGLRREPAERYLDGKARIVAWKKLEHYPLVAIAALSEQDALVPYRRIEHTRTQAAAVGALLLALLGIMGMAFSARLASRRRHEEEVRRTYRIATDAANEGFFMIVPVTSDRAGSLDFRLEDCNEHGAALIGLTRDKVIGNRVSQLQPERYRNEIRAMCLHALNNGFYESEVRVTHPSPVRAKWVYRRMVRSGTGLALTVRDISEPKAHEEALSNLANTDALTKLPNRRWLSDYLPNAIRRAEHASRPLAVLFIDLDNFKNINDTLGHDAGDELLQQAAFRLKDAVRASDHVVRLGGDEFTVLLEHFEVVEDVARVARTIVKTLSEPFALSTGSGNQVNASIGISIFPEDGQDGEALLKNADIAMYAAKAAGKGRFQFYQAHLSDALLLKVGKERALQRAVERDEFEVYYQPRVGTHSGHLSSMEALVRWMSPERGIVYPADFVDLAEDNGLIVRIGEMVIEKVCRQLALWKQEQLAVVPVSINVSPLQLKTGNLSQYISAALSRHDLDAALIEVELTESAVIDKSQTVSHQLAELRRLGIKLMIDDFGTGYSSLAQLHRLDVDVLKVDQAFTRVLCEGTEGQKIFRAIVSMADALDMCVVAEGVETAEQLDLLRALACDEIQGYYISRAIAASEIARLMERGSVLPGGVGNGEVAPA